MLSSHCWVKNCSLFKRLPVHIHLTIISFGIIMNIIKTQLGISLKSFVVYLTNPQVVSVSVAYFVIGKLSEWKLKNDEHSKTSIYLTDCADPLFWSQWISYFDWTHCLKSSCYLMKQVEVQIQFPLSFCRFWMFCNLYWAPKKKHRESHLSS